MWTKHSCADGETLEAVAKKFKVKKPTDIWKYPENGKLEKAYKSAKAFKKGDKLTMPDPKAKVFIVKHGGKEFVISKSDYDAMCKALDKQMKAVYETLRISYENAEGRHDAQKKINDDFPIVSFLASGTSSVDGPTVQRGVAKGMVKNIKSLMDGKKYKEFPKAVEYAEDAINIYRKALGKWLDKLTGNAENWATGIAITRDASFVIFGAAAMTVAAPATAAATIACGAGVGASTAFMGSVGKETGRRIAGEKVSGSESASNIAKDTLLGAGLGGLTAGAGRALSKGVVDKLAGKIANSKAATAIANRLAGSGKPFSASFKRVAELEMAAFRKAGQNATISVDEAYRRIGPRAMAKVITRMGVGGTSKVLVKGTPKLIESFVKSNGTKVRGKMDGRKIAELIANELGNDKLYEDTFLKALEANQAKLEAEFKAEMRALILEELKKQPAN